ncbi:MAG: peptidoglycan DD-metalloendopeptidase family protein [Ignavibacteria bacterium]|jgi:septal ring factor EnvC (AmiA/AmiB activator)
MGINGLSKYIYVLVFAASVAAIGAGYDEILNDKNRQIEHIQKQIDESISKIRINSSLALTVQKRIDSIVSILNTLNDFLKNYQNVKYLSPEQIAIETNTIVSLETEVARTQKSLQANIINLYKHGKNYELELLLSSRTPNEYLRRNQYLQKFAQSRRKELQDLKNKKFILEEKKNMVNLSTSSKRFYIESRRNEAKQMEDTLNKLISFKSQVEYESEMNEFNVDRKNTELNTIRNYINNFTENKRSFRSTKTSRINYVSDNFDKLKGSLNTPADLCLVKNSFGDNINNATATRLFNNGIDISIAFGSKVYSVANGTVSIVSNVPYFGKVVIIRHDNDYRSVYAVLSDISVKPGDKVRVNQVIGKSGENPEGQILHFEIWHNKTSLNPRDWLRF